MTFSFIFQFQQRIPAIKIADFHQQKILAISRQRQKNLNILLKQKNRKMIKYYTSSAYRKHYSDLQKLKLLDDTLEIELYDLSTHILRKSKQPPVKPSKSPSKNIVKNNLITDPQYYFADLIDDLEVYKNITLTPIRVFKSLMLIHCCFLLVKTSPNESNNNRFNDFFKWVLGQVEKLIEKSANKEHKKRTSFFGSRQDSLGKQKQKPKSNIDILRNIKSTRNLSPVKDNSTTSRAKSTGKYANDQILSREVCLLSSIIKPYILYLQKILSIYSHYQSLLHAIPNTIESSEQSTWTILNIFKLQAPMIKTFAYIGRYFQKEYSPIVYILMEFFSKEISRMYPKINAQAQKKIQQVAHEWFVLLEKHTEFEIFYDENIKIPGAENALLLIDEISKINDVLFHVYFSKYFYEMARKLKLPQPKWFEINSKDCQFLIEYNEIKVRKTRKRSQSAKKMKKPQTDLATQKKAPQQVPSVIVGQNSSVLKTDLTNQQMIVIQKKPFAPAPKIKNSLKISGQKENKDKDDTITFRVKDFCAELSESKQMADQSFGYRETDNGDAQTLRARASKTHVVEV